MTANINRGKSNYLTTIYTHFHLLREWPTIVFTKSEGNKQLQGLHDLFPNKEQLYIKPHSTLKQELTSFLERIPTNEAKTIIIDDITFSELQIPEIVGLATRINEYNAVLLCTGHTVIQGRENNQILRLMENTTWWSIGLKKSSDLEENFRTHRLNKSVRPAYDKALEKVKEHADDLGLEYPFITHQRGTSEFYDSLFHKV